MVRGNTMKGTHRLRPRARRRLGTKKLIVLNGNGSPSSTSFLEATPSTAADVISRVPDSRTSSPAVPSSLSSTHPPPANPLWPHFAAISPSPQQRHHHPPASSFFASPSLPRFHFALVLLSLSIISITIICAIGCYLRILGEQRRNRRQRRQQHARSGDMAANAAEKERLARVNKFITRPSNGTPTSTNNSSTTVSRTLQPLGANTYPQRIVPQITITASGGDGVASIQTGPKADESAPIPQTVPNLVKNGEKGGGERRRMISEMGPEEFIRTVMERVEKEQQQQQQNGIG